MKKIIYQVNQRPAQKLIFGHRYDHNNLTIEFAGVERTSKNSTVYVKIGYPVEVLVPISDSNAFTVQNYITKQAQEKIPCQLVEYKLKESSTNEYELISNSDIFFGTVLPSLDESKIPEVTDPSLDLIYTQMHEMYLTIKSAYESGEFKGDKGDKGDTGDKGADGYTPIKGTDYWTDADKQEIVDDTVEAVQPAIDAETQRATKAESELSNNVNNKADKTEVNRLIETEKTERQNANTALETKITDETTRAKVAESANSTAIETETERATKAETALKEDLNKKTDELYTGMNEVSAEILNRYTKSETYSQEEVNDLISKIPKFAIEVVDTLPTSDISETTVYLLKTSETEANNLYTEYVYIDSKWEMLGTQKLDLSNYYKSAEVDALIETEKTERQNAYSDLSTNIANEATVRENADKALEKKITDEVTTARAAEQANANAISDEITRAKAAESKNAEAITSEVTRAKAAENVLQSNIDAEAKTRKEVDSALETKVSDEVSRAKAAEQTNSTAITTEVTRAKAAESANSTAIEAETKARKEADTALETKISDEVARAKSAEQTNTNAITTEVSRAETAENTLQSNIDAETKARENADTALETKISDTDSKKVGYQEVSGNTLYMYTDSTKAVLLATLELPAAPVQDVQINGSSIVSNGVATVPIAKESKPGVVGVYSNYGVGVTSSNNLYAVAYSADKYAALSPNTFIAKSTLNSIQQSYVDNILCSTDESKALTTEQQIAALTRLNATPRYEHILDYTFDEEVSIKIFNFGFAVTDIIAFVVTQPATDEAHQSSVNALRFLGVLEGGIYYSAVAVEGYAESAIGGTNAVRSVLKYSRYGDFVMWLGQTGSYARPMMGTGQITESYRGLDTIGLKVSGNAVRYFGIGSTISIYGIRK